jgi:lipopolysaccharide transport system ATP-binding protein
MANTAISVENISKIYRLGEIGTGSFYGDIKRWWADQRGLPDPFLKIGEPDQNDRKSELLWALKNVSFSVKQGEAIGIIGKNGAGKSTLLKILSRLTAPTEGVVRVTGGIASLLEVGTGFHPELTGRENIFLNSAILGMDRRETQRKFDEIVEFSGVEKFIDTPVKHYSSGMYVRLAFAVAAHLNPDIFIVDEVLAVGDRDFQEKSLARMKNAANEGHTVVFVSHAMGMISSVCERVILLDKGTVLFDGDVSDAIKRYFTDEKSTLPPYEVDFSKGETRIGDEYATLLEACIEDETGKSTGELERKQGFRVRMRYQLHNSPPRSPYPNFHFYNLLGQCAFVTAGPREPHISDNGVYESTCFIPGGLLNADTYFINLALTFTHEDIHVSFHQQKALAIVVKELIDDETLNKDRSGYDGPIPGAVRPKLNWEVREVG